MNAAPDPFWLLVAALVMLPLAFAVCLRHPSLVALGFVGILCVFSSSTWGQLQAENNLYSRGTGLFYFSLLNLLLWAAAGATALRALATPNRIAPRSPFPAFLAATGFMLLGHVAVGSLSGQDLNVILGYNGILNVANMAIFSILLLMALNDEQGRRRLLLLIIGLAAIRAVFGLVRYFVFGGDSANPYQNFENLDIRLVYFDIADNYIASLAAFVIAWLLLMPEVRLTLFRRLLLLGLLALEIATVALSFRRSSLGGLALMFVVLMLRLPLRRQLQFLMISVGGVSAAAMAFMQQRLQFNSNSGGLIASLLYDVGPQRSTEVSRFYELEVAAKSLDGSWLFGLGSWGTYYGNESMLDYHFGKFDFVHSGFGHLVLKSGMVGLLLFVALLAGFVIHYLRIRRHVRGNNALLADAGMASLLFWTPTLLVGTPVIEFRSMLLIGLALAMPYLALCDARRRTQPLRGSHAVA